MSTDYLEFCPKCDDASCDCPRASIATPAENTMQHGVKARYARAKNALHAAREAMALALNTYERAAEDLIGLETKKLGA